MHPTHWAGHAGAPLVLQDTEPWVRYLPEAWQQTAAPGLRTIRSRRPPTVRSFKDSASAHHARTAYWAPLLHLTTFGLGWRAPEVGLWRWMKQGMPVDDAVLATIARRYGKDVELMATWLTLGGGSGVRYHGFAEDHSAAAPLPVHVKRWAESVSVSEAYRLNFGGGSDSMHLAPHLGGPYGQADQPQAQPVAVSAKVDVAIHGDQVNYILAGDQYLTLFRTLHAGAVPSQTGGRSTRVGLICPPIGWLGNYRQSRTTGLWFRGQHRWHALGNETEREDLW